MSLFDRFTDRARKVLVLANQEAIRLGDDVISTEHILLGLAKEGSGIGANVLKDFGLDLRHVRDTIEILTKPRPDVVRVGTLPKTAKARMVIEYAIEEAKNLNHNYVGTEHLLLGLIREEDGLASKVFGASGVTRETIRQHTLTMLGVPCGGTKSCADGAPEMCDKCRMAMIAWLTKK